MTNPPDGSRPAPIRPPVNPVSEPTWLDSEGSTTTEATVVTRRGGSRFAVIGVVVALVVGGAFAIRTALSAPTGPETASAAVDSFFAAVDDEDLVGMVEVWLPSERASVLEPGLELVRELERLDLVDDGTADRVDGGAEDRAGIGYDVRVEGLETSERLLGDGVAMVTLHAGRVTMLDGAEEGMFGPIGDEDASVDLAELDEPLELVVVEEDGGWYLSIWYQVAELARSETDEPLPDFGNGVTPIGAATPEGAVVGLIEAAVDIDPRSMIARLDPEEARALHDYAPLFLDDADDEIASFRAELDAEGVSWRVERLDVSASEWRGHTVVSLDAFGMRFDTPEGPVAFDVDTDCVRASAPDEDDVEFCWETATDAQLEEYGFGRETLGWQGGFLGDGGGITVIERDGGWFVTGVPTFMHTMIRYLEIVGDDDGLLENWFVDELSWTIEDWIDGSDDPEWIVETPSTTVPTEEWDGTTTTVPSGDVVTPTTIGPDDAPATTLDPSITTTTGPDGLGSTTTIDPGPASEELAPPMDPAWIPAGQLVEPTFPGSSWLSAEGITDLWWVNGELDATWGVIAETASAADAARVVENTRIEWEMTPHPDRPDLLTDGVDVVIAHGRFVIALNDTEDGIAVLDEYRTTLPLD